MTALARKINALHDQAMEHTDLAILARRKAEFQEALQEFQMAAEYETKAARLVPDYIQPSHSVLHRSAAALCVDCGNIVEAERLIAAALAGNPPSEIRSELNALSQRIEIHKQRPAQQLMAKARQEFKEDIRESFIDALAGNVHDISTLWDGIDDESE